MLKNGRVGEAAPMRPFSVSAVVAVCCAVGVSGCFDASVGAAALSCDGNADCPAPLKCQAQRCVGDLDDRAPAVVAGSVVVDNGGLTRGALPLIVRFAFDETLPALPRVRAVMALRAADLDLVVGDDGAFTATLDIAGRVGADVDEGPLDLVVDLVDAAGNARVVEVARAAAVIDVTAPQLRPGLLTTTLTPPVDALVDVSALGVGGRFSVDLLFDEDVAVVSASADNAVVEEVEAVEAAVHVAVVAGDADGVAAIDVEVSDAAGNVNVIDGVAAVVVDVSAPVFDASGFVLERRPHAPSPSLTLLGAFDDAGAGDRLVVFGANDASREALLATFAADGGQERPLGRNDQLSVWLALVDRAGNLSAAAPVPVPVVRYVASASVTSPHRLRVTPRLAKSLAQPFAVDADVVSGTVVAAGAVWTEQVHTVRTQVFGAAPRLGPRSGATFDVQRRELIVLDAERPAGVWGFDGRSWRQRATLPDTFADSTASAVGYDFDDDRVWVLADGRVASVFGDGVVVDHGVFDEAVFAVACDDPVTRRPRIARGETTDLYDLVGGDDGPTFVPLDPAPTFIASTTVPTMSCADDGAMILTSNDGRVRVGDGGVVPVGLGFGGPVAWDAERREFIGFSAVVHRIEPTGRLEQLTPFAAAPPSFLRGVTARGAAVTTSSEAFGPSDVWRFAGGGYRLLFGFSGTGFLTQVAYADLDGGPVALSAGFGEFTIFDGVDEVVEASDLPPVVSGDDFFVVVNSDSVAYCRAPTLQCGLTTTTSIDLSGARFAVDNSRDDLWALDAEGGLSVVHLLAQTFEANLARVSVENASPAHIAYDGDADAVLIGVVESISTIDGGRLRDWLVFKGGELLPMPQLEGAPAPERRSRVLLGNDRGGVVLGLGFTRNAVGDGVANGDTWVLQSYATARPALILDVDLQASGVLASHTLRSVDVEVVDGAANDAELAVLGWAGGALVPLSTFADRPGRFIDDDQQLHIAVAAALERDDVPGRVLAVDEFNVVVDFVAR